MPVSPTPGRLEREAAFHLSSLLAVPCRKLPGFGVLLGAWKPSTACSSACPS